MKTLSREEIQRMTNSTGIGGISRSGGGGSGGGGADLTGYATQLWVNDNYLSIDFFSSLFKAYGPAETQGDPDVEIVPNDTESTISNIKAMFGFWTEQYISALGQGSGGGGGGGATALDDLTDVEFSGTPSDGQVLKYNGTTHKWYNGNDEGLTSLPWSSITGKPTTLAGYGITDAYTKTEADAKYLTSSSFSAFTASSLNISATIGTTTRAVQAPTIAYIGINDEAASSETTPSSKFVGTKFGASSGFYMTGVYPRESSPADIPCNYGNILNILGSGGGQLLAEWCNTYKTGHLYYRSHRDYLATGGWTPCEKIAFISDFSSWALAATKPSYAFSEITGTIAANQLPDLSGTYAAAGRVTALEGYFSNGVANNAARLSTVSKTAWGQTYWTANGVPDSVSGSIEAGNSGGSIEGFHRIELNNHGTLSGYGGAIDFHFNGSSSDYTSRIIEDASGTLSVNSVAMWSGYVKATRFYLSNSVYFQLDANGDVQLVGAGLWTNSFISALGQGSGGGGGGATTLSDLLDVEFSGTPSDGQVLKYNGTTHKWYNGNDEGLTSLPWSSITGKPTTLSGYGITDAYISSGTIHLGSNSITPLTSFTETDPTVPAWAKASTKPSYSFSELTGSVAFSQLPTMYWADVAVSNSSNNNTSPQFGNLRLRPGSGNYGSYLRFGDGDFAYLAELSDDHLTYRAGSHTFNVSSNEAVQINSSGLRIGGSSGVVLSWDSTNNALKVQKADGTAANLYATGGVSALGLSGGSGGSIGTLTVTSRLNIGNTDCNLQQGSGGDFHINCNNYLYLGSSLSYIDSDGWMTATGLRAKVDNSVYFLATEDGIDFFSSAAGYHPIRIYYNGSWRTLNMQAAVNAGLFS